MDDTRPASPRASSSSGAPRALAAGERVGEWIVAHTLATGGFGTVYVVHRASTREPAALKLLHAHLTSSAEMLARFDREIQVIGRLRHPNIVQLVDAGFAGDGRPYLCMEYLDGDDLAKLIGSGMEPSEALAIFEPLCDALAMAHAQNVVHRDLKASNVVVCRDGRVVLLDFGIAKLSDALAPELTATHQSLGTPACMAPEQIQGKRADARTDVYALGGLLFHMLTGKMPFQDPSPTMSQYLHMHARRPRASSIADVTPRLDEVIARAMAIEPAERFPDAVTLLAAARAALRDTKIANAVSVGQATAILVRVVDRTAGTQLDEPLLDDLEAVMPAFERFFASSGLQLALDLGTSAVFVARPSAEIDPVGVAIAAWEHVEQRAGRDPRVQIGLAVHRDEAMFVGDQIQAASLLRTAGWRIPETIEGVWVTSAIAANAPSGRRVR